MGRRERDDPEEQNGEDHVYCRPRQGHDQLQFRVGWITALFVEHGRALTARTRWQDRLNPFWCRIADGCNMNRPIDRIVAEGGFARATLERFHRGPGLLAHMYRGVATRAE